MRLIAATVLFAIFLPFAARDASTCDIAPRVTVLAVPESGLSFTATHWRGCPDVTVLMEVTYLDADGQQHTTHAVPVELGQQYNVPRWQVWPGAVRMNLSVRFVGQNYTVTQ